MRLSFRALAFAAVLGLGVVSSPKPADASVAIAVYFDDLVSRADTVAVVTGTETKSVWEDRKIVTYTRLRIERHIAGETMTSDMWVKTLGGIVGDLGQTVSGEPAFGPGQTMVFLKKVDSRPTYMVIERAQGQYPITKDAKTGRLVLGKNSEGGMLLPPKAPTSDVTPQKGPQVRAATRFAGYLAMDVMLHRPVDDVAKDIAESWQKLHATK
ncbi:MAG: hypothetical protein U0174_21130 [Polyangiaceae bacterium]